MNKKLLLLLAIPIMILAGCAKDSFDGHSDNGSSTEVTLTLHVPGAATPQTRALSKIEEHAVKTLGGADRPGIEHQRKRRGLRGERLRRALYAGG